MAAKYYPDRIGEIDSILDEVTNADGRKYRRTFFLDHDPSVESQFTEEMKQRAKLIAKKSIMSKVERTIRKIS